MALHEELIRVTPAVSPRKAQPASVNTIASITGGFVTHALGVLFADSADIHAFFAAEPDHLAFIAWFNANAAGRGPWAGKVIGAGMDTHRAFDAIWDRIPDIFEPPDDGSPTRINLLQFLALVSIFINETGDTMKPVTEKFGRPPDHPGVSYLFDAIPEIPKRSYNVDETALYCFNDADFLAAHGDLHYGESLAHTTDTVWAGTSYPKGYPTDLESAGMIAEADFCKFRGRGYIQTTFRSSYKKLIQFVLDYAGRNATVLKYSGRWSGRTQDAIASMSSNADWDDLFQSSDNDVPCAGIRLHNRSGKNYLALSTTADALNGQGHGSIRKMGRLISGGDAYASLFYRRVVVLCNLLGNGTIWV